MGDFSFGDALVIDEGHAIPRSELVVRASRSGGAGGQHVNTSSTRIELLWNPRQTAAFSEIEQARLIRVLAKRMDGEGWVRIVSSESRSQRMNRDAAEERLVEMVRKALIVPKRRKATKPSKRAMARRVEAKKRRSSKKVERRRKDWE